MATPRSPFNRRQRRRLRRAGVLPVAAVALLALSGPALAQAPQDVDTGAQVQFFDTGTDTTSADTPTDAICSPGDPTCDPNATDNNTVDANAGGVDANGNPVDANGNPVDANGNPVDANGNPVDPNAPSVGDTSTPVGTEVGSGECTDWALNRRPDMADIVNGNAQEWTSEAAAAGRPISDTPHQGDLMVMQGGAGNLNSSLGQAGQGTGHVAYVESVNTDANGNPTSFIVSEQNWNGTRSSTTREIQVSDLQGVDGVSFVG